MKKLLLLLLCVPLMFSCGEKDNDTKNTEKNEYNRYDVNDTYIRNVLDFDDEEEMDWILPNTILYHKNDEGYERRISEGIVYEIDNNNLSEKFISDNITYKIVFTKNNIITSIMELVSGNEWIQREYYKSGQLEEEEEYLFKNNEFIKCGFEKLYNQDGKLISEDINWHPLCDEQNTNISVEKGYIEYIDTTYANGDWYQGEWKDGKPYGEGEGGTKKHGQLTDCTKACCLGCKATDGEPKCKNDHSCCVKCSDDCAKACCQSIKKNYEDIGKLKKEALSEGFEAWNLSRSFEKGEFVYAPSNISDWFDAVTGKPKRKSDIEPSNNFWMFRANKRTTEGTFIASEWDMLYEF